MGIVDVAMCSPASTGESSHTACQFLITVPAYLAAAVRSLGSYPSPPIDSGVKACLTAASTRAQSTVLAVCAHARKDACMHAV